MLEKVGEKGEVKSVVVQFVNEQKALGIISVWQMAQ